jgi:hypothetical protein
MRPGMPLGRKHFRRSRDAPNMPIRAKTGANGIHVKEKPVASPVVKDPRSLMTCLYLSRWLRPLKILDDWDDVTDSESAD